MTHLRSIDWGRQRCPPPPFYIHIRTHRNCDFLIFIKIPEGSLQEFSPNFKPIRCFTVFEKIKKLYAFHSWLEIWKMIKILYMYILFYGWKQGVEYKDNYYNRFWSFVCFLEYLHIYERYFKKNKIILSCITYKLQNIAPRIYKFRYYKSTHHQIMCSFILCYSIAYCPIHA